MDNGGTKRTFDGEAKESASSYENSFSAPFLLEDYYDPNLDLLAMAMSNDFPENEVADTPSYESYESYQNITDSGDMVAVGSGSNTEFANVSESSHMSPPPAKKKKVTHKRIKPKMDSDDDLLWHLKLAKWSDKDIHQRFVDEHRGEFRQKTIGTRFGRMKQHMKNHTDEMLENGSGGWHEGDDDVLESAIIKAEAEIQKMLDEIDKKRWELVSDIMKDTKPVVNYSGKACKKRWESKQNGTATIPLEHRADPSPEVLELIGKRKESEEKIRQYQNKPRSR